jgi:5-amino-6-(5-phospho-D-ribitylamino)uracil phosphatase
MTDRLSSPCEDPPWLVALDIDGNLLHEGGSISDAVIEQVRRLDGAGHQVMLATGRSFAATIPVLSTSGSRRGSWSVPTARSPCTLTLLRRAATGANGATPLTPTDALRTIHAHPGNARFAVEDEHGHYRYTGRFPDTTIGLDSEHVRFDEIAEPPCHPRRRDVPPTKIWRTSSLWSRRWACTG